MAVHLKALLEKTEILQPHEAEDQTCPVCYEDYLQDPSREFPRKISCGHVIGTECLLIWASSQTHATSINCPWCRNPIIHSIHKQYLQTVISAYAEAAAEQIAAQIARAVNVVDRALTEHRLRLLAVAILFCVPGVVFLDNFLARLPFVCLYACISVAIKRRLGGCHCRGVILMIVGLCMGAFLSQDLGRVLFDYGKAPFKDAIAKAYTSHNWLVLGSTLAVVLAQAVLKHPAGELIAIEAGLELGTCILHNALARWIM